MCGAHIGTRKRAWRIKSKLIEFESDTEEDHKQEIVDREAEEMQQFFLTYHNLGDNLPCHAESAGSALDGQESADSAPGGPHVKAARSKSIVC